MFDDEPYVTHDEELDICLSCPRPSCNNCIAHGMDAAKKQREEYLAAREAWSEAMEKDKETEETRQYKSNWRPKHIAFKELYLRGLSIPEIARITGLAPATCYTYRHRYFGKKKKGEAL